MPNAKTHDVITVASGAVIAPLTYFCLTGQYLSEHAAAGAAAWLLGAHLLSGIMFSPDLDIDSGIDNRWGPFFWIWRPYMWIVPHRSRWLSHGLVFPPLLRLGYFFAMLLLIYFGLAWGLSHFGIVIPDYYDKSTNYLLHVVRTRPREVGMVLLGFVSGGAVHTVADWLVTGSKALLRRS